MFDGNDNTPTYSSLVSGSTFDGKAYQIALDSTAFDHGGFSKIIEGQMLGEPLVVAVKVFSGILDRAHEKMLVRELRTARLLSLKHPLIVGFLGTATVGEQVAIVSLYMANGNLTAYMKKNPNCDKKKLILQVAEAVDYLHNAAGVVHGDLKCSNVLISDFGEALLADFGLSTFAEKSQLTTATMTAIRQMGTLRFAAPELLLGEGTITLSKTRQSDVYAFGMLVLEAITEQLPWSGKGRLAITKAVCSGRYPPQPRIDGNLGLMSHSWWKTCRMCWEFKAQDRPGITDVRGALTVSDLWPSELADSRLLPFEEDITSALYTPDGRAILAASNKIAIRLFDIASGNIRTLWATEDPTESTGEINLVLSVDGHHLACIDRWKIQVLDTASGAVLSTIDHCDIPDCLAISPDGTRVAWNEYEQAVRVWDVASPYDAVGTDIRVYSTVYGISFSPDGAYLAIGSEDGKIHLSDSMTGAPVATLDREQHGLDVSAVAYSPDGETLQSEDIYERPHFAYSPDGMRIVAGYVNGTVIIWDVREPRPLHVIDASPYAIGCVAFSPSGKYVASGSQPRDEYIEGDFKDKEVCVWDARDGKQVGRRLSGVEYAQTVAFSPDGRSLVCVCDGKVRVWDVFDE